MKRPLGYRNTQSLDPPETERATKTHISELLMSSAETKSLDKAEEDKQEPGLQLDLVPPLMEQRRYKRRGALSQGNSPRLLSLQAESDMWHSPETVDPRTRAVARLILLGLLVLPPERSIPRDIPYIAPELQTWLITICPESYNLYSPMSGLHLNDFQQTGFPE